MVRRARCVVRVVHVVCDVWCVGWGVCGVYVVCGDVVCVVYARCLPDVYVVCGGCVACVLCVVYVVCGVWFLRCGV